jgi:hypothetical protein
MSSTAKKRRLFSALGLLVFKVPDGDERIVELLRCDQLL